jgi:predicted nucleotidyltransferase
MRLLQGYRVLASQLIELAQVVDQRDPNIGAVLLFGSTARLDAHEASDVDLLFLCFDPHVFTAPPHEGVGMSLLVDITSPEEEWGLVPVVTDLCASDVSEALLANIARDGVVVYQLPSVSLPRVLAQVPPLASWLAQVQRLLHEEAPLTLGQTREPGGWLGQGPQR